VLIAGYEDDPLADGAPFLDDPLFWPTYLVSTVAVYDKPPVTATFGVAMDDVMTCYRRLADPSSWPVFRVGLRDGHEIDVIYRNLEGDKGIDYLLCRPGGEHPLELATLEAHHRGPGLRWPELVAAAAFTGAPYGVVEPEARLLLLFPACLDADVPEDAKVTLSAALAGRGAGSGAADLAEGLLEDAGSWPRWRRQADGTVVCDGRHSPRNPDARGSLAPDDLLEATSALGAG
jgi:hypothetical protein